MTCILPLLSDQADLARVGGKGASLSRMARAGFPIPPAVFITVEGYRRFIRSNHLEERIRAALPDAMQADLDALEQASARIRSLFTIDGLPADLRQEVIAARQELGCPAVAVRSSATAEDLPEMSFAGQQDTFLNVVGEPALLQAVVDCWASLWTARAIGYRLRNNVPQDDLALAVVIQCMVQPEVSGVMFTANPLTGLRSETVIDAVPGLGEALVSGRVEPDHVVVDTTRQAVLSFRPGARSVSIRSTPSGGTRVKAEARSNAPLLEQGSLLELADLGTRVASFYGFPQDIEWAWASGRFHLLQSRPVTTLFPLPEGVAPQPLKVYGSFAAVQGMLDPLTPLGRDVIFFLFAGGGRLLGYRHTPETVAALEVAGERLWSNITPIFKNTFGRKVLPLVLSQVEPAIGQALRSIWEEPQLQPERKGVSPRTRLRLARFFIPLAWNVILNILFPLARGRYIVSRGESILARMQQRMDAITGDRHARLARRVELFPQAAGRKFPPTLRLYISGVAAGMASLNLLNRLAGSLSPSLATRDYTGHGWQELVLGITRGIPNNPTTIMDLHLWSAAKGIRSDPEALNLFRREGTLALVEMYKQGSLPSSASRQLDAFLQKYGSRGLAEIDAGRPRWREDPSPVIDALRSYLAIEDPSRAPDVVFEHGVAGAGRAADELISGLRRTRRGWLKARLARFLAGRVRALVGLREEPKFFMVRLMGLVRQALLESGRELVEAGELEQPDDLVYLRISEIRRLAAGSAEGLQALIRQRRASYQRELLRRQVPKIFLSDGRAFYEGVEVPQAGSSTLQGSPVSPGTVEGRVRVVLDPRRASLAPGEILVCPGTDPSWTPLFLTAGGLVMEVGGMMTHGAVVAREYGIPAVVGVHQAVTFLHDGERILLDGSSGCITLLDR